MKKVYIQPTTEVYVTVLHASMLNNASPTGSKVYNDKSASSGKTVLGKDRGDFEIDDESSFGDLW